MEERSWEEKLKEVAATAEIVFNEQGEALWVEAYYLSGIYSPGESFVREYKEYRVMHAALTLGTHRGALLEYVVKLITDRTPKEK